MKKRKEVIGVIGLGYVGLPLLINFSKKFEVIGFDLDEVKVNKINSGESMISHISNDSISSISNSILPRATSDFSLIKEVDVILICVPTPITKYREPDLSFVENAIDKISAFIKEGALISLESTTYPGTTEEIIYERLKKHGFKAGKNIFITYSPEREDPGSSYKMEDIPKIIGGVTKKCSILGSKIYSEVFQRVHIVKSVRIAEMAKLLENIYRAVNIGMINEFKIICDVMDIDPFEVIEAASTKPFGFVPYYPGPGWGGHCIPVDPFYLSWKVKEFGKTARFIELAGELNNITQDWVVNKINYILNQAGKSISTSKLLLLGLAYKPNIDDARESPSLNIFNSLKSLGADVYFSDPFFSKFPKTRKHSSNARGVVINKTNLKTFDAVILLTNHDAFDYDLIKDNSKMIIDTRGVYQTGKNIFRA